jgi:ZIP family zinc transporter
LQKGLVNNLDTSTSFDDAEVTMMMMQQEIIERHQEKLPLIKSSSLSEWSSGADLESGEQRRAWRVAMLLFISLLIHNFPEGLAVAASAMESTKLGVTVAIGIMIHNIPEGIAIAVPCLAARPDKPWLAFALASGSGLAEPLGASVALLLLKNNQQSLAMENVLAFVAGIMIMVALCELFPEAKRHDTPNYFAMGTMLGILLMIITELYVP